jgi:pseudouridine-5'-phosphate glycosidase
MHKTFKISEQVATALKEKKPIVALESTIISHGMPYPQNLETAKSLEDIILSKQCVPATIAIIQGIVHVGLTPSELEDFAKMPPSNVHKVSTRDLPIILAKKLNGSTTVAATSFIASKVGIKFFATGGLGGVHRGVEETLDISNDLVTLAQTRVCVVSAGVKAILDIAKTIEMLETLGVPVVTFGQENFPAFYTSDSKIKSPASESDKDTIADMLKCHFDVLEFKRAFLVANPISKEHEANFSEVAQAIDTALEECTQKQVKGRDFTPYMLRRVAELTEGRSLASNIKLVQSNAGLAADLALKYSTK